MPSEILLGILSTIHPGFFFRNSGRNSFRYFSRSFFWDSCPEFFEGFLSVSARDSFADFFRSFSRVPSGISSKIPSEFVPGFLLWFLPGFFHWFYRVSITNVFRDFFTNSFWISDRDPSMDSLEDISPYSSISLRILLKTSFHINFPREFIRDVF